MTTEQIIAINFCWAAKVSAASVEPSAANAEAITYIDPKEVSQWYAFLREKCSNSLINSPNYMFGGPGVVVQIDESLVARRKYVGRVVQPQWIFGLYDTSTKLGHIELVDDRSANTLIPLIQKFIRPGTTIYSYQWGGGITNSAT